MNSQGEDTAKFCASCGAKREEQQEEDDTRPVVRSPSAEPRSDEEGKPSDSLSIGRSDTSPSKPRNAGKKEREDSSDSSGSSA